MTTATKKFHPELECSMLDILAAATKPLSSTELSVALTTSMRRWIERVRKVHAGHSSAPLYTEADVMTYNGRHNYWEVTGATVSALLAGDVKDGTVVLTMNATKSRKFYALKTNVERWAAEEAARLEAKAAADKTVWVRDLTVGNHGTVEVIKDNVKVAEFVAFTVGLSSLELRTDVLGTDEALRLANELARTLRIAAAKAMS